MQGQLNVLRDIVISQLHRIELLETKVAALESKEAVQPAYNSTKPKIKPGICRGTGHGSCKGDTPCDPKNACFTQA